MRSLRRLSGLLLALLCVITCPSSEEDRALAGELNPEVLEALHEAPEVVEELVRDPRPKFFASPRSLMVLVFGLTFFIEEVAVATSAYLIGTERLSHAAGFFPLFIGIFLSDLMLYFIGILIARSRWLRGYVDVPYYQARAKRYLDRGMWVTIIVSRLVPGMLIPIFLMLGFSRMNLKLVSFVTFCVTGLYSLVALYVLLYMGWQISDLLGAEAALAIGVVALLYVFRNELWSRARTKYFLLRHPESRAWPEFPHRGLPALRVPRHLSFFEGLPGAVTYMPVIASYFANVVRFRSLTAPLAANPGIENSGICGESKSRILEAFPPSLAELLPRYRAFPVTPGLTTEDLRGKLGAAGLEFPLVAKPDIGYMSRGVEFVPDLEALMDYLERFPQNQTVILQEYVAGDAEAGIFYARPPSLTRPVVRVAMTYFPFVIGDGRSTVRGLARVDPRFAYYIEAFRDEGLDRVAAAGEVVRLKLSGSTRDGGIHTGFELPPDSPLAERIDAICRSLPEFWIGRFDVKFASVEELLAGRFKILELNGAGGEDLTAWDPTRGPRHTYRTLFRQMRWLFEIGDANRRRGCASVSGGNLVKAYIEQESLLFRLTRARYGRSQATRTSRKDHDSSIGTDRGFEHRSPSAAPPPPSL